ncbi:nuclear autoantigen Sp-100-like isoform X3 [Grammomys surdaster]|uniref:nuclear autoantigen Sp-100-like isoform X3 n=1 Tax=Grammomys surdaster TaxID=491861 RepID=UPI00109F7C47|nr:nuclear autoantigen Sp-100-like isoform X3 [Grammomys surdaster]
MESSNLGPRMSSEHESTETFPFELIFKHFKSQKVKISNVIRSTFPFLESLRDREFITGKMYDDLQDSCRALIPVDRVIYRALEELEKNFKMEVLRELFNEVNMEKYPGLKSIRKNFENVFPTVLCFQGSDGRDPNSQLSLEQGPSGSCSQESLTWSPLDPSTSEGWRSNDRSFSPIQVNQTENHQLSKSPNHLVSSLPEDGLSEDLHETVQINRMRRDDTSNTSNNIEPERKPVIMPGGPGSVPEESCELQGQMNGRHAATPELHWDKKGAVDLNHEHQMHPCFVRLVDIKKESSSFSLDDNQQTRARTNQNEDSEIIELSSGDSDDEDNFSKASTSVPSQPDTSDSDSSITMKGRKRTRHVRNNPILGKDGGKRRKRRGRHGNYLIRNIKIPMRTSWRTAFFTKSVNPSSQRGRKRGPRIPRKADVDFSKSELPVTCGNAKGTLHKELFYQGILVKSIQSESGGLWFTPRGFEIEGNRERSKNWRQSIRCHGWTLKELIKEKKLQDLPRKKKEKLQGPPRKKLENPKVCKVCRQQNKVYRCATCKEFYHKNCHIPPVENKSLWHCTFCKTKNQLRGQKNEACLKEAEVLKRKMSPEEQLKCELLLLIMYCCPKSGFFIRKQERRKKDFPDLQEHMWLNKIKNRLNKKAYHSVQRFVGDMRLIFQNHSIFYKNKFKNLGISVGNKFEKTFKRIFSIEDTSEQHQPCEHTVLLT